MAEEIDSGSLVRAAAQGAGVPPELVDRLLALESAFPDFTIYGSKTDFARRVAAILDEASKAEGSGE